MFAGPIIRLAFPLTELPLFVLPCVFLNAIIIFLNAIIIVFFIVFIAVTFFTFAIVVSATIALNFCVVL